MQGYLNALLAGLEATDAEGRPDWPTRFQAGEKLERVLRLDVRDHLAILSTLRELIGAGMPVGAERSERPRRGGVSVPDAARAELGEG